MLNEEALKNIETAKQKFEELLKNQLKRTQLLKEEKSFIDYAKLPTIMIGVVGGDGIGPSITQQSARVLSFLLEQEIAKGKVSLQTIDGLTLENRIMAKKAIPDDVLVQLKKCHVILKGPTTTPSAADGMPNIESANVAMRKELDLFANVRPVKIPENNIDWVFFRENTEGAYTLGSSGIEVNEDLAFDFTVATTQGCERVIRAAFEYAKNNGCQRVSAVTKANVIKTTDGKFLKIFKAIAKEYPNITTDDWYIDIMTAKLIDEKRRQDFQVMVLPNLYGDILTDEAAELQGGVGTAGSANIGKTYAMFEAIHGSAPRMVTEGREAYADPCSVMRACVMLLAHIGFSEKASKLEKALNICTQTEKKLVMTGRSNGATGQAFADYVMETIKSL